MELDPNLRSMTDDLSGELAWTRGLGWLAWNGKVWDDQFGTDAAAERVNRWRETHGYRLLASASLRRVLSQLQATLRIEESTLDARPGLLNVQNGVVDLLTGELLPHDPALLLTRIAGVGYDPGATNPAWDRVVTTLPAVTLNALEAFVTHAVTGRPSGSAIVVHGRGQSGKSTFFRPLCEALGNHARHAANWPSVDTLRGARLVVAEDIESINTDRLRRLLAGDPMIIRHIRRDTMTVTPSHSLALVMGPQGEQELDEGTRQNLEFINFEQLAAPDPSLRPLLKEPSALRAALAWAVHQAVQAARA